MENAPGVRTVGDRHQGHLKPREMKQAPHEGGHSRVALFSILPLITGVENMKLYECRFSGCRTRLEYNGYCPTHKRMQQRDRDKRRGSAAQRGYGKEHQEARELVLERDKFCKCTQTGCHGLQECPARSFIADHFPFTRKQLVEMGRDPNDPSAMRGLCKHCHDVHTGRSSAGGFIKRS